MSKKITDRGLLGLAALAALVLALGLAACGGSDDDSTGGGSTEPASTEPADSEGGGEKAQVSLAMEQILTGQQFGVEIKEGIEAFATEDGAANVEIQGPPEVNPEVAQKQAADLLSKNPEGFGFAPFPPELWTRTAKTIDEQVGPNVLVFNERPSSELDTVSAATVQTFVGTADRTLARESAEKTIELAKLPPSTTGEAIIGQCVPQEAGVLAMRTEGVEEVLAEKLPNVKVVVFDSKPTAQESVVAWTTQLAATPDPAIVIGVCTEDGQSVNKVMTEKGYDFPAGAMDVAPGTITGLENGNLLVTVTVNWWFQGYTATRMLAEAVRGAELPEGFINTGQLVVTKDNLAQLEERGSDPETYYAGQIEEMFGNGMPAAVPIEEAYK
jgi:ABC-type sugar transport system substrate-binding protein